MCTTTALLAYTPNLHHPWYRGHLPAAAEAAGSFDAGAGARTSGEHHLVAHPSLHRRPAAEAVSSQQPAAQRSDVCCRSKHAHTPTHVCVCMLTTSPRNHAATNMFAAAEHQTLVAQIPEVSPARGQRGGLGPATKHVHTHTQHAQRKPKKRAMS